jgi:hypothetical protein
MWLDNHLSVVSPSHWMVPVRLSFAKRGSMRGPLRTTVAQRRLQPSDPAVELGNAVEMSRVALDRMSKRGVTGRDYVSASAGPAGMHES